MSGPSPGTSPLDSKNNTAFYLKAASLDNFNVTCHQNLRRLPRVLRPRATWVQVWREILNPREVHAKKKNKDGFPFRNIVQLKFTKLLEFWPQ